MKTVGKSNAVLVFFLTLFIAYTVMPVVSLLVPAYVRIGLLLINVILLASDAGLSMFFRYLGKLVPIYIIAFFNLTQSFISGADIIYSLYDISGSIIISCAGLHLLDDGKEKTLSRILFVVIVINVITIITTIYGNTVYPAASRQLATGMTGESVLYNQYRAMNIGGFGFVYDLVLPTAILPFVFKQTKTTSKVLSISLYSLILYCAFITQYTTATLFVLFFGVFFFLRRMRNFGNAARATIILAVLFVLLAPVIFLFLSSSVESDIMSARLGELGSVFSGEGINDDSDASSRLELYMLSLGQFLSSPLIGVGTGGGGHSFILDNMAKYGIFGLLALFFMIRAVFKLYIVPFKTSSFYGYLLFGFLSYITLLFLNPFPMYMSVTFLLPLISKKIEHFHNTRSLHQS